MSKRIGTRMERAAFQDTMRDGGRYHIETC
jgi:hypothetical protein